MRRGIRTYSGRGIPLRPPPIGCEDGQKLVRDFRIAELRRQGGVNEPSFSSESRGVEAPRAAYGDADTAAVNPVISAQNNNVMQNHPPLYNSPGADYGFEDNEIYFDSNADSATIGLNDGEISWDIGTLNNQNDIRNCVQLAIGSFYFPKIYNTAGNPEFFYFQRVYMEVTGLPQSQGVLATNNSRYHFEFEVQNLTSQAVKLVPVKESFFLRQPLLSLATLQLRFMVPATRPDLAVFKRVPIPPSKITVTVDAATNPLRLRITGGYTTNILRTGTNVAMTFTGTTGSAAVDAQLTGAEGAFVTNIVDNFVFEVSYISAPNVLSTVDGTLGAVVGSALTALVLKNRIAIPMRFTSLVDKPGNRIAIGHL